MSCLRFLFCLLLPAFSGESATAEPPAIPRAIPLHVAKVVTNSESAIISAPKLHQDLLSSPLSATVSSRDFLDSAMVRTVKDAAIHAPNTFFTEFSARKLSNPRFRGIGSSAMHPGITTYLDGVPQFNANSSSLELLDIEQIDFVRSPLGALYGRNTVGGLINITSRRPSLSSFSGEFQTTFGSYNLYDFRGSVTTPLIQDQLGFSFAGGHTERDGFSTSTLTGNDIDNRSANFGKAQFLWTPGDELEVRLVIAGESANDGDYALNDLAALRHQPRQTTSDFAGFTSRDVFMPTLLVTYHANDFDFTSTTGYVGWETIDSTDFDNLPFPLSTLYNREKMSTWTQEFRFANPATKPITLGPEATLRWQAGIFLFSANYEQQATASLNPPLSLAPSQALNQAQIADLGIGTYVQSTLTLRDRIDITTGLRCDYENKDADLLYTSLPAPGPSSRVNANRSFNQVTPQAAISYRLKPDLMAYFSMAGGYKAGGFNSIGPSTYGEEHSWNYEMGFKGRALDDKAGFSLAAFHTDWRDVQLNQSLGINQVFTTNSGDAISQGLELNLDYKLNRLISIFGSSGWQDTHFLANASNGGLPISGRQLPFTPDYTTSFGFVIDVPITSRVNLYARADIQTIGSFNYDAQNTVSQDAYTLANFRFGIRGGPWHAEAFVNNAFGTNYIPVAISHPGLAPSGFVGESGAPTTIGLRAGIRF
jgi:iron complex outermembrane receptor protein